MTKSSHYVVSVKSTVKISSIFVAFLKNTNFKLLYFLKLCRILVSPTLFQFTIYSNFFETQNFVSESQKLHDPTATLVWSNDNVARSSDLLQYQNIYLLLSIFSGKALKTKIINYTAFILSHNL